MENQNTLAAQFQDIKQKILCGSTTLSSLVKQNGEVWLDSIQKELQDTQWFLGEERSKREYFEGALKASQQKSQELEGQLNVLREQSDKLQKELADAQWFLGEERAKHR